MNNPTPPNPTRDAQQSAHIWGVSKHSTKAHLWGSREYSSLMISRCGIVAKKDQVIQDDVAVKCYSCNTLTAEIIETMSKISDQEG